MNRLQKKCVLATVGIHLLLLTILIVGPAFFNPQPKPDDTQLLDVIPANLIDAAFSSGVRQAAPPPPAPAIATPPQPAPPTPIVQPPPPVPKPVVTPPPSLPERVANFFKPGPKPEPVKPAPEKPESKPHQIQVNTTRVSRAAPKNSPANSKPDNSRAIATAIRNLQKNLKPGTTIDMPGNSTVAYANYASAVKSVYDQAWNRETLTLPDDIANKNETVKVSVTIARDGTVVSARITAPSGDTVLDASVQRTLDRVTFIAPFPDSMKEKEWTRSISFNPELERMSE